MQLKEMVEKKIWLIALVVLNAVCLFPSAAVQAHLWSGHVWQSTALNPLYFYQGTMTASWTTAVSSWNNVAGLQSGDFARTYDPEGMYFTVWEDDYDYVEWYGWTDGYATGGYWVYGTVEINTYYCTTSDIYRCVSIHELGHIWGLDGEPTVEHSIMNADQVIAHNWVWTGPQTSDIDNVNSIY